LGPKNRRSGGGETGERKPANSGHSDTGIGQGEGNRNPGFFEKEGKTRSEYGNQGKK